MNFIYEVRAGYSAPPAASGFFSTPAGAAKAVTKQLGMKMIGAFNPEGIETLLAGLKHTSRNGLHIGNVTIYKRILR